MYKCKHFRIEELVPPSVFKEYGDRAWQFLDERALRTLDVLRDKFGKIIVNDWVFGGKNKYRGLRPIFCKIGAPYSQHRFGRAFDCIFKEADIDEVRDYILENKKEFRYINAIELQVSWLHFDVRNCERIMKFMLQ